MARHEIPEMIRDGIMDRYRQLALIVNLTLAGWSMGCQKMAYDNEPDPQHESQDAPEEIETIEEQPASDDDAPDNPRFRSVSAFLRSEPSREQPVSQDHGQVILTNSSGEVLIVGVTRSKLYRDEMVEPSVAGDLFVTRFGKEWSAKPVQVPVAAPPAPLPEPLLKASGGRLFDSGSAVIVGELQGTQFLSSQRHLAETNAATQNVFLANFGPDNSGLSSFRLGLTGVNTATAVAAGNSDESILIAGQTESGLLKNETSGLATETSVRSNYLALIDRQGQFHRHLNWPVAEGEGLVEHVQGLSSDGSTAFLALERSHQGGQARQVFVQSVRIPEHNHIFIPLSAQQVCADYAVGARDIRVRSVDYHRQSASADAIGEVLVAVDIVDQSLPPGFALPCVEVFAIKPHGSLVSLRQTIFLPERSIIAATLQARFAPEQRILLTMSRDVTDSRGAGEVVVSYLFFREQEGREQEEQLNYQGTRWPRNRPAWHRLSTVDGLKRRVVAMIPSTAENNKAGAWVLSNDISELQDGVESLVHLGSVRMRPAEEL